jgi:hypothetical protein
MALFYVVVWGPVFVGLNLVNYLVTQKWMEMAVTGQFVVVICLILVFPIYKLERFLLKKYFELKRLNNSPQSATISNPPEAS